MIAKTQRRRNWPAGRCALLRYLFLGSFVAFAAFNCDSDEGPAEGPVQGPDNTGLTVGFLLGAGGLGDQSFNDMTYAGLGRARRDFGIRIITEAPRPDEEARAAAMQRLLDQEVDVIVVNGWEFTDMVRAKAPQHRDTKFLVNDQEIAGLPNVVSTTFAQGQGSFLVGALAGWMTKTNRVGFIGGMDHPQIRAFLDGYRRGLAYANPAVQLESRMLAERDDFSGFERPDKGHDVAIELYRTDVDIIYAVAGLSGNGVIAAARERGKYAIGVDADQDHMARGHVLTSMMKRLDRTTYREISLIVNGSFEPGVKHYGLAEGGVSLTEMRFTRHLIPDEVLRKVKEAESRIIIGQIRVTE